MADLFSMKSAAPALGRRFDQIAKQDLKAATAIAVTYVAKDVQGALTAELRRTIRDPTPYTLGSIRIRRQRSGSLFSMIVYVNDEARGSIPPSRYLAPLIYGGSRRFKGLEVGLQAVKALGSGKYAMPSAKRLDAFGNLPKGQARQILSYFQAAQLTAGYEANTSARLRKRLARGSKKKGRRGFEYFISGGPGRTKDGRIQKLAAGIWQRYSFGKLGSAVKPVLLFTGRAPQYKPVIMFYPVADRTLRARWPEASKRALHVALASSKSVTPPP